MRVLTIQSSSVSFPFLSSIFGPIFSAATFFQTPPPPIHVLVRRSFTATYNRQAAVASVLVKGMKVQTLHQKHDCCFAF
jgi:hypothetical protein